MWQKTHCDNLMTFKALWLGNLILDIWRTRMEVWKNKNSPRPTEYLLSGYADPSGKETLGSLCGRSSCLCRSWILHFSRWSTSCTCKRREGTMMWLESSRVYLCWSLRETDSQRAAMSLKIILQCFWVILQYTLSVKSLDTFSHLMVFLYLYDYGDCMNQARMVK